MKTNIPFLLLTVLLSLTLSCTKDTENLQVEEGPECLVEINGEFIPLEVSSIPKYLDGGFVGFLTKFNDLLKYPAEARENDIEGRCILFYEINKNGEIENITIEQDPGGGIGQATFHAFEETTTGTSYSPAMLGEEPVRVLKSIIVTFSLHG